MGSYLSMVVFILSLNSFFIKVKYTFLVFDSLTLLLTVSSRQRSTKDRACSLGGEIGTCCLRSGKSSCITCVKGRKMLLECFTTAQAGVLQKIYSTITINLGLGVCFYWRNMTTFVRNKLTNCSTLILVFLFTVNLCVCVRLPGIQGIWLKIFAKSPKCPKLFLALHALQMVIRH